MGNPCQLLVDACRCRYVEIAMRDFLASYYCALLTMDQCSHQLTVLSRGTLYAGENVYRGSLYRGSIKFKSSQLCLGRVALSAIGWYQKGPCVNYEFTIKV